MRSYYHRTYRSHSASTRKKAVYRDVPANQVRVQRAWPNRFQERETHPSSGRRGFNWKRRPAKMGLRSVRSWYAYTYPSQGASAEKKAVCKDGPGRHVPVQMAWSNEFRQRRTPLPYGTIPQKIKVGRDLNQVQAMWLYYDHSCWWQKTIYVNKTPSKDYLGHAYTGTSSTALQVFMAKDNGSISKLVHYSGRPTDRGRVWWSLRGDGNGEITAMSQQGITEMRG